MQKQKLYPEFQSLTPEQIEQIQTWKYDDRLSQAKLRSAIKKKFGFDPSRQKTETQLLRWECCEQMGITEEDFIKMLNGEPVAINADGLQIVRQRALILTMRKDVSAAQLKMLQSIFDYDFRKEVIQTRLELAKNRDARAQNSSARADKLADHKIELDSARLALARDRFQFQQSRAREQAATASSNPTAPSTSEPTQPDSPTSEFELRVLDYLKKYPQYTREEIVEYLSLTADQRRDRFFGGFGIYGDELTLHKARIDRDLCESREAHPDEEMKLVFERELPTLEEARRLETEARAALELEPLDYPVDEDLRAKLGLPIKNFHNDDCLCNKCSSQREEAHLSPSVSPIQSAPCTPVQASHTPDRNPNLNPPIPSENSLSSVASAKEDVLPPPPPTEEQMRVASQKYALARFYEQRDWINDYGKYWRHRRDRRPPYETKLKQCPCGSSLPCPHHEPFPQLFWEIGIFSIEYAQFLRDRNIPFEEPKGLLA